MKTISVPVDAAAAERLNVGAERDGDLIEIEVDGAMFEGLFASGWVRQINEATGSNIDDYEDEHIEAPEALDAVERVTKAMSGRPHADPFDAILALVEEAKQRGTGLHFHF